MLNLVYVSLHRASKNFDLYLPQVFENVIVQMIARQNLPLKLLDTNLWATNLLAKNIILCHDKTEILKKLAKYLISDGSSPNLISFHPPKHDICTRDAEKFSNIPRRGCLEMVLLLCGILFLLSFSWFSLQPFWSLVNCMDWEKVIKSWQDLNLNKFHLIEITKIVLLQLLQQLLPMLSHTKNSKNGTLCLLA